jgi:hypothetical protein
MHDKIREFSLILIAYFFPVLYQYLHSLLKPTYISIHLASQLAINSTDQLQVFQVGQRRF